MADIQTGEMGEMVYGRRELRDAAKYFHIGRRLKQFIKSRRHFVS
jgi:hypothetical protein